MSDTRRRLEQKLLEAEQLRDSEEMQLAAELAAIEKQQRGDANTRKSQQQAVTSEYDWRLEIIENQMRGWQHRLQLLNQPIVDSVAVNTGEAAQRDVTTNKARHERRPELTPTVSSLRNTSRQALGTTNGQEVIDLDTHLPTIQPSNILASSKSKRSLDEDLFTADSKGIYRLTKCGVVFHDSRDNTYFHASCGLCYTNCNGGGLKFRGLNGLYRHLLGHVELADAKGRLHYDSALDRYCSKTLLTEDDVSRIANDPSLLQGVRKDRWIDYETRQQTATPTGVYMPAIPATTATRSHIVVDSAENHDNRSHASDEGFISDADSTSDYGALQDDFAHNMPHRDLDTAVLKIVAQNRFEYSCLKANPMVVLHDETQRWYLVYCKICTTNCCCNSRPFRNLRCLAVHGVWCAKAHREIVPVGKDFAWIMKNMVGKLPLTEDQVRRIQAQPTLAEGVYRNKGVIPAANSGARAEFLIPRTFRAVQTAQNRLDGYRDRTQPSNTFSDISITTTKRPRASQTIATPNQPGTIPEVDGAQISLATKRRKTSHIFERSVTSDAVSDAVNDAPDLATARFSYGTLDRTMAGGQ